jgi:hypothetical protein
MRPFPVPQVDPEKLRRNGAQAGVRTLLVAALCLLIGFGLGGLWQSRRAQQSAVNTAGEAPGRNVGTLSTGTTAVLQSLKAPVQIQFDSAVLAEVKRQIPNFASVSLEEGSQILREAALKDLQAALVQTQGQIKEVEQRVAQMEEAKSETGKQEALKDLQRLQADQVAKLGEFTTKSSAQIEALRQLKESAR